MSLPPRPNSGSVRSNIKARKKFPILVERGMCRADPPFTYTATRRHPGVRLRESPSRGDAMTKQFELPDLPYAYDALEPHVDETTMRIHHTKHHAAYLTKLNAALERIGDVAVHTVEELLSDLEALPEEIRVVVRNNGGGYVNHNLFWTCMHPEGGGDPTGALGDALIERFGGVAAFRKAFGDAATGRFGSGWAWLVVDDDKSLHVTDSLNQDSPWMRGQTPILGLDVWEHAYYLKYQNRRPEYVDAWWNVVDWTAATARYEAVLESAEA